MAQSRLGAHVPKLRQKFRPYIGPYIGPSPAVLEHKIDKEITLKALKKFFPLPLNNPNNMITRPFTEFNRPTQSILDPLIKVYCSNAT